MAREQVEQLDPADRDTFTPERARDLLDLMGVHTYASHGTRALKLIGSGKITRSLAETSGRIRAAEDYLKARKIRKELKRQEALLQVATDLQNGRLEAFPIDEVLKPVVYIKTEPVVEGVECDVYRFEGDDTRDLGILRIQDGFETPVQRILQGERTIEGLVSGRGHFLQENNGLQRWHNISDKDAGPFEIELGVGDIMRWSARGSDLIAYEICYPPYQKGRFEAL